MKRFTDTEIWNKPWFRKLDSRLKNVWRFLCDHCDPAGVWEPDWELISFYLGEPCSEADLENFNQNAVMRNGKVFLPQFIEFQYGKLSHECKPHERVFEAMQRHGLKQGELFKDIMVPRKTVEKNSDKPSTHDDFEAFWSAYPRKVGKAAAMKAWGKNGRPALDVILSALDEQKGSEQWTKDGGKFIPHPATWLNGRRWEDEAGPEGGEPDPEKMTDKEILAYAQG